MKRDIFLKNGKNIKFQRVKSFIEGLKKPKSKELCEFKVGKVPAEGNLFQVNHTEIDRTIFESTRIDDLPEWIRLIIKEAFAEVDRYPEKYDSSFYTLSPEKKWNGYKSVKKLDKYAKNLGGHIADWVELALEWAQRISNGESWKVVCDQTTITKCYRMIFWKNGYARLVGPKSVVFLNDYYFCDRVKNTVPLVVINKHGYIL